MVSSLTLTILVDDEAGPEAVRAEHGLSFWIDADCCRVLFDSGQGQALWDNLRQLKLNPAEVDAVVISHGHYDHTGGFPRVLSECQKADFFLHSAALRTRYARSAEGSVRSVGFPLAAGELLRSRANNIHWTKTVTHLHPAAFVTGEIPRRTPFELPRDRFFLDPECITPDPFTDDQALIIETEGGAIVFLGCSHAGVENTLACALSQTRSGILRAVIGGMHLADASPEEIARLGDRLEELGPRIICPCHCTGARAKQYMKNRFPKSFVEGHAGTVLKLNGGF